MSLFLLKNWPDSRLFRIQIAALGLLALCAVIFILFPDRITAALNWRLPESMLPRSAGTFFPGFADENGFSHQLFRLGWTMLLGVAVGIPALYWPKVREMLAHRFEQDIAEVHYRWALAALAVCAGAAYLYFSWWPDAYPSNARIHWVDGFYERAQRHTYALTKFTFQLFYDSPRLLVAILGTLHTLLFAGLVRRLLGSRLFGLLAGISWLISSNVLLFANMAEDVNLSFVTLLATSYAFVRRWPIAFGVLAFLASTARPTHGLLFCGLWGAEFLAAAFSSGFGQAVRRSLSGDFLGRSLAALLVPLLAWHGWMAAAGQHFLLFTDNSSIDILSGQESIRVDRFAISQFSGAALFHFFWVFPLPALALWITASVLAPRMNRPILTFVLGVTFFMATNIFIVEFLKMFYFNVRYLTYYFPYVLALAWLMIASLPERTTSLKAALVVILAVSTLAPYNHAPARREKVKNYPLSQMYEHRLELRRFLSSCERILTDRSNRSQRNYIAYLLKRENSTIAAIGRNEPKAGDCLFVLSDRIRGSEDMERLEVDGGFTITRPDR